MNMRHPMLPQQPTKNLSAPPARPEKVYEVGPPPTLTQEEIFQAQMKETAAAYEAAPASAKTATAMSDEMFEAQTKRREAINKLVMLREPMTKNVTIDGQTFRLRLVTPHDASKIREALQEVPEFDRLYKARLLALCASLVEVDGIKVEDIYSGPPEQNDPFWMRYYEVSQWPNLLVSSLFSAIDTFVEEVDKRYSESFLK